MSQIPADQSGDFMARGGGEALAKSLFYWWGGKKPETRVLVNSPLEGGVWGGGLNPFQQGLKREPDVSSSKTAGSKLQGKSRSGICQKIAAPHLQPMWYQDGP